MSTLPPLREVIAAHGLTADKGFGQHFLLDLNLTAKIARLGGDLAGVKVLEVGPGPGGLTRALLDAGAKVTAVEMDARFIPALEEIAAAHPGRLTIIRGDALKTDAPALLGDGRKAVIANLPYNVGTPLYTGWLRAEPVWWDFMALMFQQEVAQRICAAPGSSAYGRLAVFTAARAHARLALKIPARAFTPPPRIDSAVVVVTPLKGDERYGDMTALETVTESAFGQRRKMLRSSLKAAAAKAGTSAEALLEQAGIAPTARAETVDPAGFIRLARAWRAAKTTVPSTR